MNDYKPQMGALHTDVSSTTSLIACCNRPSAATAHLLAVAEAPAERLP